MTDDLIFDKYNLLDNDGNFLPQSRNNIEIPAPAIEAQRKVDISGILDRYYKRSSKKQPRLSEKVKGNQKQLLSNTIDKLGIQYPFISEIKGYLMDTAALESGFKLNSSVSPKIGSASGWFGFIDSTKRTILKQLGISATREQFNNSPEIQVLAAAQLYQNVMKQAEREGVLRAAHSKGFTNEDVAHAYWLNPSWAKAYFLHGKVAGADAFGTTVPSYLKKIHKYKS